MKSRLGVMGLVSVWLAMAGRADIYVSPSGDDGNTGASWAQAFATISNAVAQAGDGTSVWVSNGVYSVSAEIVIANGITVAGVYGRDITTVQSPATNCRIFRIAHPDAILEGITISKGEPPPTDKRGAGVFLASGTLRNCIISNNVPTNTAILGVGVFVGSGTVTNCLVTDNHGKDSQGTGIYITNGLVVGCVVQNNGKTNYRSNNGAGVYMTTNSVVTDCLIQGNAGAGTTYCLGGGVFINAGLLKNSTIVSNWVYGTGSEGGGVCMKGGRVENCVIRGNHCSYYGSLGGGGVALYAGTLANCTVAGNQTAAFAANTALGPAAGVQWAGGGRVTNCIVWYNTRLGSQSQINLNGNPGWGNAFFYSCAPDLQTGINGNTAAEPRFADWRSGDFQLLPYSPCVDAGTNTETVADRDGNARPADGRGTGTPLHDMGAYERPAITGYFNCYFQAPTNEAFDALNATFTASVFGPNTNGLYYWWDFGNGSQEGPGLGNVSQSYTPGFYSVSLAVSNETGAVTNWSIENYIRVGGAIAYVATNGGNVVPYDTWNKASTSILAAVHAAVVTTGGTTRVVVSNGTYAIPSMAASIVIDRGVTVETVNGASNTTVWGTAGAAVYPNFELDHPEAVVDGFTIGNANFGAVVNQGTLRRCIVRNNAGDLSRGGDSGYGGGLRVFGGLVEDCVVISNSVGGGTYARGGGIYMTAGLVRNCTISRNITSYNGATRGAGVHLIDVWNRCILRGCLVRDNEVRMNAVGNAAGAGVSLEGGAVENCTIVSNNIAKNSATITTPGGGGLYISAGTALNTIVYYNTRFTQTVDNVSTSGIGLSRFSCATELTNSLFGNITNEPRFVNAALGNYRLAFESPCINAGTNLYWVEGAFDLDGNARRMRSRVDMGAYERSDREGSVWMIR